jgi:hypothetical protein
MNYSKPRREALSWLRESRITSPFASNHFQGRDEITEVVKKLYSVGASLVEVQLDENANHSDTLIIHGSEQCENAIFSFVGQLHPDELYFERGNYFWRLWWD